MQFILPVRWKHRNISSLAYVVFGAKEENVLHTLSSESEGDCADSVL